MKQIRYLFLGLLGLLVTAALHASSNLDQEREDLFAPILNNPPLRADLMSHAKKIPTNFNYTELFGSDVDVLLVGEEHHDPIPARDINLMIKNLVGNRAGLTHVASEFLLASEQPFLDAFAQKQLSYEELKKKCKLGQRAFVAEIARRYGVKVVGLEIARTHEDYPWALSAEGLAARNQAWADKIVAIKRQNPQAKILVHAGSYHTQLSASYGKTLAQVLKQNGLKVKVVEFTSVTDAVWKKLNISGKYDLLFTIPDNLKPYVRADYVVYAPFADYTSEEKARISEMSDSIYKEKIVTAVTEDGCLLDPDNPMCSVIINTSRIKLK